MREQVFVLVGSRKLRAAPTRALGYLATLPDGATVGLRSPTSDEPEIFERIVAQVAKAMGLRVKWYAPEGQGREATYYRDIRMVDEATCVLAFFAEEEMSGGTEHVVEKAIDREVPVYSYGLVDDRWRLIGSHDRYDAWPGFTL